ncbi:MAG: helix-turn-helix transcriptional regulator [Clostridia bacterium]|nr:helix-turn-helix transcriptional regulator [Clostridia bacterium]
MQELEYTQVKLAEITGITNTNISNFLLEYHTPSYKHFVQLLYAFDCSADYLLGLTEIHTEENLNEVPPFSIRLRFILKTYGVSQEKLKRELPVSGSVLYKWTSGKSNPSTESLIRLAEYFGCSVDYLIGRIS